VIVWQMMADEARLALDSTEVDKQDMERRMVVFLKVDCLMVSIVCRLYGSCWAVPLLEDEQSSQQEQISAGHLVQGSSNLVPAAAILVRVMACAKPWVIWTRVIWENSLRRDQTSGCRFFDDPCHRHCRRWTLL